MTTHRPWLSLCLVPLLAAFTPAAAQELVAVMAVKPADLEIAVRASREALAAYATHAINDQNFAQFGFKSAAEARSASLGEPLVVVVIEHAALKRYAAGASVRTIWKPAETLWFPVLASGVPRTKLEMTRAAGQWVAGELGGTREADEVTAARDRLPQLAREKEIAGAYERALVRIPLLRADFLFAAAGAVELLVPAMAQPERLGLKAGQAYPASEVLASLKGIAEKAKEGTIH